MIRTWISLVPAHHRAKLTVYAVLALVSVVVRAVGAVLLIPLVGALFSAAPHHALAWLGWLSVATVAGWIVDTITARTSFDLGFAVLDHLRTTWRTRYPGFGWTGSPPTTPRRPVRRSRPPAPSSSAWWSIC